MPLSKGKSKQAFSKNVETEMHAGKPQNQALAIAYAMKRKAKSHKMAEGGRVSPMANEQSECTEHCESPCSIHEQANLPEATEHMENDVKSNASAMSEDERSLNEHGEEEQGPEGMDMAEGGQITDNYADTEDGDGRDMVGKIMAQRQQHYSEGGRVANEAKSNRGTDYLATDDDLEQSYTGANSGDELSSPGEDERRRDVVSRIMASRKKKDRLPNPR